MVINQFFCTIPIPSSNTPQHKTPGPIAQQTDASCSSHMTQPSDHLSEREKHSVLFFFFWFSRLKNWEAFKLFGPPNMHNSNLEETSWNHRYFFILRDLYVHQSNKTGEGWLMRANISYRKNMNVMFGSSENIRGEKHNFNFNSKIRYTTTPLNSVTQSTQVRNFIWSSFPHFSKQTQPNPK